MKVYRFASHIFVNPYAWFSCLFLAMMFLPNFLCISIVFEAERIIRLKCLSDPTLNEERKKTFSVRSVQLGWAGRNCPNDFRHKIPAFTAKSTLHTRPNLFNMKQQNCVGYTDHTVTSTPLWNFCPAICSLRNRNVSFLHQFVGKTKKEGKENYILWYRQTTVGRKTPCRF